MHTGLAFPPFANEKFIQRGLERRRRRRARLRRSPFVLSLVAIFIIFVLPFIPLFRAPEIKAVDDPLQLI